MDKVPAAGAGAGRGRTRLKPVGAAENAAGLSVTAVGACADPSAVIEWPRLSPYAIDLRDRIAQFASAVRLRSKEGNVGVELERAADGTLFGHGVVANKGPCAIIYDVTAKKI